MSFTNNKAIFEQIADRLADEIMAENYPPGGRIPSVREYAALLQVNTNTAIKGYELLAREGIIFNKRGMGYFVAEDARHHIAQRRQEEFMETTLPELFRLLPSPIGRGGDATRDIKDNKQRFIMGRDNTKGKIQRTILHHLSWRGMAASLAMAALPATAAEPDSLAIDTMSYDLGDVTVTAQRKLVKNDIDKLTYDVANDETARTKNTLDMLRSVPLVTIDGQENISIKKQ